MIDEAAIVRRILSGYALPARGHHGVRHWARVLENGLRIATGTGADVRVVTLFALFHDSRRVRELGDPGHGRRGAELAGALRGELFELEDPAFAELAEACERHTDGHLEAGPTVQACWDSDRLDLGRVGIVPRPHRLCTDAARALLPWAHGRATADFEPPFVRERWGV